MVRVCASTLLAASLTACGGESDTAKIPAATTTTTEVTTTTKRSSTTTTTAPTTTTTSVQDAMAASMRWDVIASQTKEGRYGSQDFILGFELENRSAQPIVAHQGSIVATVTDVLGRSWSWNLRNECTDATLAPGEVRRSPHGLYSDIDAYITGLENCTISVWEANPYIEPEDRFWEAVNQGAVPQISLTIHRIVFADGTALGTAR